MASLNLNWICLLHAAFSAVSTERLSRVRTLRRCLPTTLRSVFMWTHGAVQRKLSWPCFLCKDRLLNCSLLSPYTGSQATKGWCGDGTMYPFTGRHKAPWLSSWSFAQVVWVLLLSLAKKMSWRGGPKAADALHLSRLYWIWIKKNSHIVK